MAGFLPSGKVDNVQIGNIVGIDLNRNETGILNEKRATLIHNRSVFKAMGPKTCRQF